MYLKSSIACELCRIVLKIWNLEFFSYRLSLSSNIYKPLTFNNTRHLVGGHIGLISRLIIKQTKPAYLVSLSGGNNSFPHNKSDRFLWILHWRAEMLPLESLLARRGEGRQDLLDHQGGAAGGC